MRIWIDAGFHKSWEATSVIIIRRKQKYDYKPHLSATQQVYRCLLPVPRYLPITRLRHHELIGSESDGVDFESLVTLLEVAIANHNYEVTCLVEDEGSGRLGDRRR